MNDLPRRKSDGKQQAESDSKKKINRKYGTFAGVSGKKTFPMK